MTLECQGRVWSILWFYSNPLSVNSSRFPQPVSLLERKFEKKLNVAVATMKDFFLQQINKPTKSNYFLKVWSNNSNGTFKIKSQFTICEVLNLFNVLFQIVFLDIFFDGVFTTYGKITNFLHWLTFTNWRKWCSCNESARSWV